jgi:hypothetical protein
MFIIGIYNLKIINYNFDLYIMYIISPFMCGFEDSCAPKFLVDPLEGPSMRQCGSG